MITKEYLESQNINPLYCDLHWLAGYELKDWLKLSPEEKQKHWEKWEFWKKEWMLLKLRQEAAVYSSKPLSPKWDHKHAEGDCYLCSQD